MGLKGFIFSSLNLTLTVSQPDNMFFILLKNIIELDTQVDGAANLLVQQMQVILLASKYGL